MPPEDSPNDLASPGVERPAPGAAPSAFRIFRAGLNNTEYGPFQFTERSAGLLLAAQSKRGIRYPFDFEHRSCQENAPTDQREAVGWHSLEVRDGDLWAIDCKWGDEARAGLEANPPSWRYYSPVFTFDPQSREILTYVNCALTNAPATWQPTDLAIAASVPARGVPSAPLTSRAQLAARAKADPRYAAQLMRDGLMPSKLTTRIERGGTIQVLGAQVPDFDAFAARGAR